MTRARASLLTDAKLTNDPGAGGNPIQPTGLADPAGNLSTKPHPSRALTPPVAVRLVDLGHSRDLELGGNGQPYQSALIVGLRDASPIGAISVAVNGADHIPWEQLRTLCEQEESPLGEPRVLLTALPDISVVVTTCSNPVVLVTVASILSCDPSPQEVIVVENRPAHSSVRSALKERFGADDRVRYVEETRPGLGASRNAGLLAATCEVVAFTDDDVEVDSGWVGWIARAFAAEPDAGCVTGLILPGDLMTYEQTVFEEFAGFAKGFRRRVYRLSAPTSSLFPFAAGEFGSGASTALRTSTALSIGGFDSALGAGTPACGAEDLDIYIRVLLAGYALVYEPAAILWHKHPDGASAIRRKIFRYGVGLSAMLTKYAVSGYAVPIFRRAPAGVRHLGSAGSRKNANKSADYACALDWIERAGMVAGPVAYALSRRRERRAGYASTGTPSSGFRPVWVGELDLTMRSQDLKPPLRLGGVPYAHARLLARVRGTPVGLVEVPLNAGTATGATVDAEAARQLRPNATALGAQVVEAAPDIDATIIVCTRDRPESLRATLASILTLEGADHAETIVVDNAPGTTATAAIIDELADPRIRYVVEPYPGLSRARNRGVAEARSDIIAFTDDDVIVDRGWLRAIARGFARTDRVACVTGLIVPTELETPAQSYFDAAVKWSSRMTPRLFHIDHPEADPLFPYRAGEFGAGANFAVTRAMVVRLGGFDEALGAGSPTHGGEDLDLFARVILAGAAIAYEPTALVWHSHRSDLDDLRSQILGYRTGLSAYACRHLFSRRAHRILLGAAQAVSGRAASTSAPRPLAPPMPGMLRHEVVALANGPGAYLRGRLRARRRPRILLHQRDPPVTHASSGTGAT